MPDEICIDPKCDKMQSFTKVSIIKPLPSAIALNLNYINP